MEELHFCIACEQVLPITDFEFRKDSGKYRNVCKPCDNLRHRINDNKRRYKVLKNYGGDPPQCACCGERAVEFLAIDHKDGGGYEHRKSNKDVVSNLDRWLVKNGLPDGFRVLCHNCNQCLGSWGYCPHQGGSFLDVMLFDQQSLVPPKKDRRISDSLIERIVKLSNDGRSAASIARELGLSHPTILKYIKRATTETPDELQQALAQLTAQG